MIDLELTKHNFQIIKFNQYDKNYTFKIKLVNYTPVQGDVIKIEWKINNSTIIQSDYITVSNTNILTVKLLREVTLNAGKGHFNVVVENTRDTTRKATFKSEIEIVGNSVSENDVSGVFAETAKEQLDNTINQAEAVINSMGNIIQQIEDSDIIAEVHEARGNNSKLNERLDKIDNDYTSFPPGTKPSKGKTSGNSFKIVRKNSDNQLVIIQATNKGYIKYIFERGFGASQAGKDYGENHELLRLVGAYPLEDGYCYYDISNPVSGSFDGELYSPSGYNVIEQLFLYSNNYNTSKNIYSKDTNEGIGCYKLKYGNTVEYNIPVTLNNKINLMFLGTPSSSESVKIYISNILVKEFNPKAYCITNDVNTIGIFELDAPIKSTTESLINIKIENCSSSGYFYPCGINVKKLKDYNREYVTDFKFIGSQKDGWIENQGASDYAFFDVDKNLWFGSYHGGEVLELENIMWSSNIVPKNDNLLFNTTLDNINVGDFRILKDFSIYQKTNLANNGANMISIFSFNENETLDMDFSYYNGTINVSTFYTAITCGSKKFDYVFYPKYLFLSNTPSNTFITFPLSEGKIIQTNSTDKLQLEQRFTRFNNTNSSREIVAISDSDYYRKFYYSPIYGKNKIVKNINFSKSLDFIVR